MAVAEGDDVWPAKWGGLAAGTKTAPAAALFPRLDDAAQSAILERLGALEEGPAADAGQKRSAKKATEKSAAAPGTIVYDDFTKVDMRLGEVLSAEKVEKSKKLLKLSVDLGEDGPRQILAGISQHYEADALVGKKVVVVANLPPRKIMGLESQGMVLAASDEGTLGVLTVDEDIPLGSRIS